MATHEKSTLTTTSTAVSSIMRMRTFRRPTVSLAFNGGSAGSPQRSGFRLMLDNTAILCLVICLIQRYQSF